MAVCRDEALARQALRAYELGRLCKALQTAALGVPFMAVALALRVPAAIVLACGGALTVGLVAATWYGRAPGRAAPAALGSAATFVGLGVLVRLGGCTATSCATWCGPVCLAGGVVAGLLLGSAAGWVRRGYRAYVATAAFLLAAAGGLIAISMGTKALLATVVGLGAVCAALFALPPAGEARR